MGQRFRLEAAFDISGYSPDVQVMLQAFKDYGLILARQRIFLVHLWCS